MKSIRIRVMKAEDREFGLRLSRQVQWNQTEADWLRFMHFEPDGCFLAELDGCAAGTTTTCVFGSVAWIAMVLVDVKLRGQGIGTRLLRYALDYLENRRVLTIRLDATSAGRPVYEKLGFMAEYKLARYEGLAPQFTTSKLVTDMAPDAYRDIVEFDRKETGTDREKMLVRLFAEFLQGLRVVRRRSRVEGYAAVRPGANAIQIGPCLAVANAGNLLLSDALNRCRGKTIFVDVPTGNTDAVRFVEAAGLKIQRSFTRMYRGRRIDDNIAALWASSGPEKG